MAEFVAVAKLSEVGPGQLKHIELPDGTQVCLANVDGTFYAIDGECTHAGVADPAVPREPHRFAA